MADYLIAGTLHVLAVNSVQSLFNYYAEQLENTPSLADIQATNKMPEKIDPEDDTKQEKQNETVKKADPMMMMQV